MYEARIKAWLGLLGLEPSERNVAVMAMILHDVLDDLK